MPEICRVCQEAESKYKCAKCGVRYCSVACYKTHNATHELDRVRENINVTGSAIGANASRDPNPESTKIRSSQKVSRIDFSGFDNDSEFQRLLVRYPRLKSQLQLLYAVTLEPGPSETERGLWKREDHLLDPSARNQDPPEQFFRGGRGRGRGNRGRGRGRGRGARFVSSDLPHDERQYGQWDRQKGDQQAIRLMERMVGKQDGADTGCADEDAEAMQEFVTLCQLRFGDAAGES